GWWSRGHPALEGLVEPLDLSLCLGVAWGPVLLANTEQRQDVFESVAPTGEPGCVDASVIGQGRGRRPVFVHVVEEYGHHAIACDGLMRGAGEQIAGVVIEPVEDLHIGPVSQPAVDEVRLPHL